MRNVLKLYFLITLCLGGCSGSQVSNILNDMAKPSEGILPPVSNPITRTNKVLRKLPDPKQKIAVAVYGYRDQTGQYKPMETSQTLSRAVTQGSSSVLIKALQDAGNGSWFTVIEREMLGNLLKERRIIKDMRRTYMGETRVNPKALPPLLFAGILLEGGIIGYDSNTQTGGVGARYLGIGGDIQYRQDTITVYLRAISTKTGQVLTSVVAHKTILSIALRGSIFKFVAIDKLLESEVGYSKNEPDQIAVQQAIEKAVYLLIMEGTERGLWAFQNKKKQQALLKKYYQEQYGKAGARKHLAAVRARKRRERIKKKRLAAIQKKKQKITFQQPQKKMGKKQLRTANDLDLNKAIIVTKKLQRTLKQKTNNNQQPINQRKKDQEFSLIE